MNQSATPPPADNRDNDHGHGSEKQIRGENVPMSDFAGA